jgi:hypothetical protein
MNNLEMASVEITGDFYHGYNIICLKAHSYSSAEIKTLVATKIMNFITLSARQNLYSGKER